MKPYSRPARKVQAWGLIAAAHLASSQRGTIPDFVRAANAWGMAGAHIASLGLHREAGACYARFNKIVSVLDKNGAGHLFGWER